MKRKIIKTNDDINLSVIDAGHGQPLILLHGWSQTAAMFHQQIDCLKTKYRIIAYDMRGHGLSEKPDFGYRISRLAKDLSDLIKALKLKDVILLGHSMGASVIWSYLDLFGEKNLSKLIFVDQQALMTINPAWSDEERETAGAGIPHDSLFNAINVIGGKNGAAISAQFIRSRFTAAVAEDTMDWIVEQNSQLPRKQAGELFLNHAISDWRDVIPRIKLPTLIITGLASDKPMKSQKWLQEKIPRSKLVVFTKEENGSHFMFMENPDKFNKVVSDFIEEK